MSKSIAHVAAVAAAILAAAPAAAADDLRSAAVGQQHRAAFVGATVRLDLDGPAAAVPQGRLGVGLMRYQRDGRGAFVSDGGPGLPLAAGLAEGRLSLFVGGEPLSRIERRLNAAGSTRTLLIIGGIAAGAIAVALLVGGDDSGPCPPGVEVCIAD
jgi:hypothetical protein